MTEHELYRWIHDHFSKSMDVTRIENIAGSGMPDLNLCHIGFEVWLECKCLPPRLVLLRPEQYAWGVRRANHGGLVFVIDRPVNEPVFFIWEFPRIVVKPAGKYVRITNAPGWEINQDPRQLLKVLFPML